jgi:serine/threonine protein kinase
VAPLGRGGMGEVYRAEDLKLEQTVALKFLPDDLMRDAARLAQFHNEVRVARTISHRNVCRTYDIGDADGRRFLTMEYVDGEDLASLLRRIGRFPQAGTLGPAATGFDDYNPIQYPKNWGDLQKSHSLTLSSWKHGALQSPFARQCNMAKQPGSLPPMGAL